MKMLTMNFLVYQSALPPSQLCVIYILVYIHTNIPTSHDNFCEPLTQCHKSFEYELHTCTPKSSNHHTLDMSTVYIVLIGCCSSLSSKIAFQSLVTAVPDQEECIAGLEFQDLLPK